MLWLRFGAHLGLFLVVAVGVLSGAWLLLHGPGWVPRLPKAPSNADVLDMVKIVLSVVAGVGGVIALTVAYRKQQLGEAAHRREDTKGFTERFSACATQLGSDQPAIRLAGAHALAHLADDWDGGRQTCIDVLCAQVRMPYQPDAPDDPDVHLAFLAQRQVRHTIWRLIGNHLRPGATTVSWCGQNFDFTGAVIDGADLYGAAFSGGTVSFDGAVFSGGAVSFDEAMFSGGTVSFGGATFADDEVSFDEAMFSGGAVYFHGATFSGGTVDLSRPREYSVPPTFDVWTTPPPGLLLPKPAHEGSPDN